MNDKINIGKTYLYCSVTTCRRKHNILHHIQYFQSVRKPFGWTVSVYVLIHSYCRLLPGIPQWCAKVTMVTPFGPFCPSSANYCTTGKSFPLMLITPNTCVFKYQLWDHFQFMTDSPCPHFQCSSDHPKCRILIWTDCLSRSITVRN